MPGIAYDFKDERRNVTYRLMAYRQLTENEAKKHIAYYLSRQKRKPKPNTTVILMTTIGSRDAIA